MKEHIDLAVGAESGQDARGVVVVEEFPAEFKVEFPAELGEPFADLLRLQGQIPRVVEAFSVHGESPVSVITLIII